MSKLLKVESDLDPNDHLQCEVCRYVRQFRFNLFYEGEEGAEVIDVEVPWTDAVHEDESVLRKTYFDNDIDFDPGLPDDSPAKQEMLRQIHAAMAADDIDLLEEEHVEEEKEEGGT